MLNVTLVAQGDTSWPSLVQYQNEKRLTRQPEDLPEEGFHGTAAPVGSLAFFHIGTEQGGGES